MATIKITQTGSPIRRDKTQRATLVGLGLNKMHRTVEVEETPEVLGQIRKVAHLLERRKVVGIEPLPVQGLFSVSIHSDRALALAGVRMRAKSESECKP